MQEAWNARKNTSKKLRKVKKKIRGRGGEGIMKLDEEGHEDSRRKNKGIVDCCGKLEEREGGIITLDEDDEDERKEGAK